MRLRKTASKMIAAAAAVLFAGVAAYAITTFLTVSPTNLQGWQIQRSTSGTVPTPTPTPDVVFVNGPGTPPLGTGSVEFRIGPDGGAAAQLRHPGFAGTRLPNPSATATPAANELTELTYSTFTQQDGSGGQSPYIILQIDTDGDAGIEDLLFFEPIYQSETFCPSNPQPALVTGQWQTWDAFDGCWYSVFGTASSGPGANVKSLRTLSAALPTGQIANSSPSGLGGVRLVTGFGAGAWDNFIGNVDAFRIGVGANDTLYNFEPFATDPTTGPPATLLISEVRFKGPSGNEDEFIEVYNNTAAAHVVSPPDGSSGYAVVSSDGVVRGVIPFGTTIPARGHFLVANNTATTGYSLASYPAGNGTTATPDLTYTGDMPNDDTAGVALFTTSNPANFSLGTRLDAVGYTGADALYREGAGVPTGGAELAGNLEHSFYRDLRLTGLPKDTNDNAADFIKVSTTETSAGFRLGAPGPENTSSPVNRGAQIKAALVDPQCTGTFTTATLGDDAISACARERNLVSNPGANSTHGTLAIRRRWVNLTGQSVTRLRFRVVDITAAPAPACSGPCDGIGDVADLRARSSDDDPVACVNTLGIPHNCPNGMPTMTLLRTTLEELQTAPPSPTQPLGGGWNSSLSADVTLDLPLGPGASINLEFLLGVQQRGDFRFLVIVEALTGPPLPPTFAPSKGGTVRGKSASKR